MGILRSGGAGLAGDDMRPAEVEVMDEMLDSGRRGVDGEDVTNFVALMGSVLADLGGGKEVSLTGFVLVLRAGNSISSVE